MSTSRVTKHDGITIPTLMFNKDPNDIEEYKISWGDHLRTGESLASITWVISPTNFYTVVDQTDDLDDEIINGRTYTDIVSVWLSGGTAGSSGTVTCRAVINLPAGSALSTRTKDRSFILRCKEM